MCFVHSNNCQTLRTGRLENGTSHTIAGLQEATQGSYRQVDIFQKQQPVLQSHHAVLLQQMHTLLHVC